MEVSSLPVLTAGLPSVLKSKTDVTHTLSDMHTHNIASQIPNLDSWTAEKVFKNLGEPEKNRISRCDNGPLGPEAPPYAVPPAYFWSLGIENLTKKIKIIDFGEASFSHDERKELHTPLLFRAPESFFGESIAQPADIWAFGCTVFDIFANDHLFDGFMPSENTILVDMVDALGILPPQWWEKWESRSYYFSKDGTPNAGITAHDPAPSKSLALRIQEMRSSQGDQSERVLRPFKADEMINLQKLLAATLKYLPSDRVTADEISTLEWIHKLILRSGLSSLDA